MIIQAEETRRLGIVSHGTHMIATAMDHVSDANEAYMAVHKVVQCAMDNIARPISHRDLDAALGRTLCDQRVPA